MLKYEECGNGFPIVLIHAFPLSRKMWKSQAESLKSNYRVILPDMPGFGESARQPEPSIARMAKELAGLLDSLKIGDKVFMGGLSMGGYVALEFARQFPERLLALGLFATRAQADSPAAKEKRVQTIAALKKDGMVPFADKTAVGLLGQTAVDSRPELVQHVTGLIRGNKIEGIADCLLALANRADSVDVLNRIQCPALILAGEEDKVIPLEDARLMNQKIPKAELHMFPKAGHLLNLEAPEAFNAAMAAFLEKI